MEVLELELFGLQENERNTGNSFFFNFCVWLKVKYKSHLFISQNILSKLQKKLEICDVQTKF